MFDVDWRKKSVGNECHQDCCGGSQERVVMGISQENSDSHAPIRVAHVIGKVAKGGVESVVFNYYRFIDRNKVQFDFIIDDDSPCDIPVEILSLGCRVYRIPSYRHLNSYIAALKKIFREEKPEIVHSHMNTLSLFSLYAAKDAGVPIRIAHSHSTAGAGRGEVFRNAFKSILKNFSCIYPTHFMGCSAYAAKWLFGERFCANREYTVLNNALDLDRFSFDENLRDGIRKELGLGDAFVVGHVGRFMPQKNHGFLIDVFREIHEMDPRAKLLLVGDGPLKNDVRKKVCVHALEDNVLFLGARDDVPRLYGAMDFFLLPSLYEGLPVTIVEAQCIGLPCLVSDSITDEAILTDWGKRMSLENSPKEWAQEVMTHAKLGRVPQKEALARSGFDIRKEAVALDTLYERLLVEVTQ
jgi:glycosyltransferase EpsF